MTIRASILLAATFLLCVLTSTAHAEVPSVDAYGGEALVLGHPHKHTSGGHQSQSQGARQHGVEGSAGARRGGTETSGGGSGPGGGSGSGGSHGIGGRGGTSARGAGGRGTGPGGNGSTIGNSTTGGSQDTSAGGDNVSTVGGAQQSATGSSGSAFGASEVLLIALCLLAIVGVGVALRLAHEPA